MGRQNKEGETRTFKLRQDLCNKIDKYAEKTDLSKTAIVERALTEFFNREERKLKETKQ